MRAHHRATRGHARVEHGLHHLARLNPLGQPHTEALPVRARVRRLLWKHQARDICEQLPIALHAGAPAGNDARQPLELDPANSSLQIGHAIVEAELAVFLEDDLI